MKLILSIIFFSVFPLGELLANECQKTFLVHRRLTPNSAIKIYPTCIRSLEKTNYFEDSSFKIVESSGNKPIAQNDSEWSQHAATVFYHLTKAKEYFIKHFGLESVQHFDQIVIRLNMSRQYLDISQFAGPHLEESFNNALTIPPSDERRLNRYDPWGYEIWFRPAKKVEATSSMQNAAALLENETIQESALVSFLSMSAFELAHNVTAMPTLEAISSSIHLETLAIGLGLFTVLPKVLKLGSKYFKQSLYLDTALIPEIIYHEFSHIVFGQFLNPRQSTPLIEGIANYYAAKIAGGDKIAHRTGNRQRGLLSRNGSKKSRYHLSLEARVMAQHNFTFQLLHHISKELGDNADQLIFNTIKKLNRSSGIKYDLMNKLIETINDREAQDSALLILKINQMAREFGL